jgi:RNA polymerase sigma factor (sigma-70 family)
MRRRSQKEPPSTSSPTDEFKPLIDKALSGDAEATKNLYSAIYVPVLQKCSFILGNQADAEDAAQEICLKVYRNINSYEGRSTFKTWLYRVTINHCYTMLRQKRNRLPVEPITTETSTSIDSPDSPQGQEETVQNPCDRQVQEQDECDQHSLSEELPAKLEVNTSLDGNPSLGQWPSRSSPARQELVDQLPSQAPSPEERLAITEVLLTAMGRLSKKEREALELQLKGLTLQEIADRTQANVTAVKRRIERALKDLREDKELQALETEKSSCPRP